MCVYCVTSASLCSVDVCELTMDPDTAHGRLCVSGCERRVIWSREIQSYPHHPQRFSHWPQLLGREALSGRCYWEVDWHGFSVLAVTYKVHTFICAL